MDGGDALDELLAAADTAKRRTRMSSKKPPSAVSGVALLAVADGKAEDEDPDSDASELRDVLGEDERFFVKAWQTAGGDGDCEDKA